MTFPKLSMLVLSATLCACTAEQLTAPFESATALLAGDPAKRECNARVRQQAFDEGLNPAQTQARMKAQCG